MSRARALAVIFGVLAGVLAGRSDLVYADYVVAGVRVEGLRKIDLEVVTTAINFSGGSTVSRADVSAAVDRVLALGYFQEPVVVDREGEESSSTFVFRVIENPVVAQIVFRGNTLVSSEDLAAALLTRPGNVFNVNLGRRDADRLLGLYERLGAVAGILGWDVDPDHGILTVTIYEFVIEDVVLSGGTTEDQVLVARTLRSRPGKPFDPALAKADVDYLTSLNIFQRVGYRIAVGSQDGLLLLLFETQPLVHPPLPPAPTDSPPEIGRLPGQCKVGALLSRLRFRVAFNLDADPYAADLAADVYCPPDVAQQISELSAKLAQGGTPEEWERLGDLYRVSGDSRQAETAYAKAADGWAAALKGQGADAALIHYRLAEMSRKRKQFRDALLQLDLATEAGTERAEFLVAKARLFLDTGQPASASRWYEKAVVKDPKDAAAWFGLYECGLRQRAEAGGLDEVWGAAAAGDLNKAMALLGADRLEKARELAPDEPRYAAAWGTLCVVLGFYGAPDADKIGAVLPTGQRLSLLTQAKALLSKAVERCPNARSAIISLASCYWLLGQMAQAEEYYRKAISLAPNDSGPYMALALALQAVGEYEKGIALMREKVAKQEEPLDLVLLARLLHQSGDFSGAESSLRRAYELPVEGEQEGSPGGVGQERDYAVHFDLGLLLLNQGYVQQASRQFWLALRTIPATDARLAMAICEIMMGEADIARDLLVVAWRSDPTNQNVSRTLQELVGDAEFKRLTASSASGGAGGGP